MFISIKIFTLTLISLLLFSACNSESSEKQKRTAEQEDKNDNSNLKKAPQFEVTTIDDHQISLEQSLADSKPMIVYFTASWCPMCAQNWPAISEVYPEYKDKVNFVAISIDPTDDKEVMTKLAEEKDLNFPLVKGTPQVMLDFGVESQATLLSRV
jgi:peroxiredoxin